MANKKNTGSKKKFTKNKDGNFDGRLLPMPFTRNVLVVGAMIAVVAYVCYTYYAHVLETRVAKPLDVPKAVVASGLEVPSMYWGSYRPGVYFGLKTRSPNSPVAGLMWFSQSVVNNQLSIRHWCEMGDFEQRYTWLEHDGQNFGIQEIHDGDFVITASFVKRVGGLHGGDWTSRITVRPTSPINKPKPLSLLFYVALDGEGRLQPHVQDASLHSVTGTTGATGPFQMSFHDNGTNVIMTHYLSTVTPGLEVLREVVQGNLAYFSREKSARSIGLIGERFLEGDADRKPNFVVHQVTVALPFEMEVSYESGTFVHRPNALIGRAYTDELDAYREQFSNRFRQVFGLTRGNISEDGIAFAKASLSNLIGGISYFHGHSIVKGRHNKEPVIYFPTSLYTAVPSRSFFPRGFLWDEGFHNLLIGRWNADITKDIVAHWLDTMNADGWIPREQILDRESRARVPDEFVLQWDTNANPPTLFLTLRFLLSEMARKSEDQLGEDVQFLARVYPRLEAWFHWFNTTQVARLPGTYRWRGRRDNNLEELNPITLASGLDDYPRASHATDDERHVDLRCWMAFTANVLADVARAIGKPWERYAETGSYLSDNALLDALHWSPKLQAYSDYGLHTDKVRLVKVKPKPNAPPLPPQSGLFVRVVDGQPELQHIDAFGYVSLFPFLLRLLQPSSDKLGRILQDLPRPDLLWTDYGLRSLAKTSPLYLKKNRYDSPPYWRGAIWLNMNYLAVEALAHYGQVDGPHRTAARGLYHRLRANLMRNMVKEYRRTGYIWEQYGDTNGQGQRAHPFTGWSALITLIMSDQLEQDEQLR